MDLQRPGNLRQRLLRASRAVNHAVVRGLHQCGYKDLRATHTALLSSLDLEGDTLTHVAKRAGMSKQAMGRLAEELITLGYIQRRPSQEDRRAVVLEFTEVGLKLMYASFEVMQTIEDQCEKHFDIDMPRLLSSLANLADELETA